MPTRAATPPDEPLLRKAKRLTIEARRARPGDDDRLAALIADLSDVHRAMIEERDALKTQAQTTTRTAAAATAYTRAAQTLSRSRKRP